MILAIDPGYANLGYAVGHKGRLVASGTLYFRSKDRLKEIYTKVSKLFMDYTIDRVLIEDFRIYRGEIRGKHKTAFVIGLVASVAYEHGAEIKLVNYRTWQGMFRKVNTERLSEDWKEALQNGSQHSRDAVMMLVSEVFSAILVWRGE